MKEYRLISWNVNGLRAVLEKEFLSSINSLSPSVVCLQETKADDSVMSEGLNGNFKILEMSGFKTDWHSCSIKKGYSGVATLSNITPVSIKKGFGIERFDIEGRVLTSEYEDFILLNIYFPNGGRDTERLKYKLEFYDECLKYMNSLREKHNGKLIVCGDFNTAHNEIDLHDPKNNQNTSGFMPIERAWLNELVKQDYLDTFRILYPEKPDVYTWWDMRTGARSRNKGWRLDYFFISSDLKASLLDAYVFNNISGSDHCPVGIKLGF